MEYPTFGTLKTKVQKALGMESEDFITDQEWKDYFNEGVDQVEAVIHTLYEDYFLRRNETSLVNGTKTYSLPSDIYANKIRAVIYTDGSEVYPIDRIGIRHDKFWELEVNDLSEDLEYEYTLINNNTTDGVQIRLVPTPSNEPASGKMIIWYIRNATKYSADTDVCDLPEFSDVILQYVKVQAYEKEKNSNLPVAAAKLQNLLKNMQDTLSNMVPDGDNRIQADLSHYEESN